MLAHMRMDGARLRCSGGCCALSPMLFVPPFVCVCVFLCGLCVCPSVCYECVCVCPSVCYECVWLSKWAACTAMAVPLPGMLVEERLPARRTMAVPLPGSTCSACMAPLPCCSVLIDTLVAVRIDTRTHHSHAHITHTHILHTLQKRRGSRAVMRAQRLVCNHAHELTASMCNHPGR